MTPGPPADTPSCGNSKSTGVLTQPESEWIAKGTDMSGTKAVSKAAQGTTTTKRNGGARACLQVAGSFFLYFNTWGLLTSYGTFEAYYEVELLRTRTSFEISTIGSLQSFLMVFLGFIAGPLYDMGYFRHLLTLGSALLVLGTVAQSFCTELWHFLLAQGLCIGIGTGGLAILSVAIPSLWFSTKLPLANGIAACGSGVGGVVFPIIFHRLQPTIGFGWTVRVIALVVLVTMGFANVVMRDLRTGPRKSRALIDPTVFRDSPFYLFVLGCCVIFLGMYTPFYYIQSFALESGIAQEGFAFYVLSILNAGSIVGRIVPGLVARRVHPQVKIVAASLSIAIMSFCLIAVQTLSGLLVVAIIYGFFTGSFFALQPTVYVGLSSDPKVIGTRFGMAFTVMSFGMLFGSPIAGALLKQYGYNRAWIWAGISTVCGCGIIAASRICKAGLATKV